MALKNRITVGLKQHLEVDADPSVSGVSAPIGSQALFEDGGVGKAYLKIGPANTDWALFQTGVDSADWKFTQDATQLNVATALSYFGTKAGSNFDIEVRRNGVGIFQVTSTGLTMLTSNITKASAGDLTISNSVAGIALTSNTTFSITSTGVYTHLAYGNVDKAFRPGATQVLNERESAHHASPADATATQSISIGSIQANKNRVFNLVISMIGTDGSSVMFKKTIHVNQLNAIEIVQDDFTSKNALASNVLVDFAFASNILQVNLSGLAGLTGKAIKVKSLEQSFI